MAHMTFPVGYQSLHPNVSMNFQMNRWYGCVGEPEMIEEMRAVAPRISTYADWKREFVALAERASKNGHLLRSGFYRRSAEFFMMVDDPDRKTAREKFLGAVRSVFGADLGERHAVPYADGNISGFLPAHRFKSARAKGTIVFFGGFDSYIEELTSMFVYLRDVGYDVIAFEGPGQGGALDESGLVMTAEWHKPVSAVLDHFALDRVTLIGLSLGGCLVMRAAAIEPRVERVIAFDALTSLLEVNLGQTRPAIRAVLKTLLWLRAATVVNLLVGRVARTNPVVEWGVQYGMHVTGTRSAFAFLQASRRLQTEDISALVRQDVLVLGGSEDHYAPIGHWYRQIALLTNARSITARLFTRSESAQNHCQVGNFGLALRTIVNWLDEMSGVKVKP